MRRAMVDIMVVKLVSFGCPLLKLNPEQHGSTYNVVPSLSESLE